MIRKLKSGKYRLYSRKKDPKTGKRRNLGTFKTKAAAQKHERAVQYFKRHWSRTLLELLRYEDGRVVFIAISYCRLDLDDALCSTLWAYRPMRLFRLT